MGLRRENGFLQYLALLGHGFPKHHNVAKRSPACHCSEPSIQRVLLHHLLCKPITCHLATKNRLLQTSPNAIFKILRSFEGRSERNHQLNLTQLATGFQALRNLPPPHPKLPRDHTIKNSTPLLRSHLPFYFPSSS